MIRAENDDDTVGLTERIPAEHDPLVATNRHCVPFIGPTWRVPFTRDTYGILSRI
jgi:hypothetical protein